MKFVKKNFWLVAIILSLVMVGCKKNPAESGNVFQETYDKMMDQMNYKVEMTINTGYGEDVNTKAMVFSFDLDSKTKGVVKVDTTLFGVEREGYREFTEAEVFSYTNIPGTGNWVKKSITMNEFNNKDINNENYFTILTNLSTNHFVNEVTVDNTKYNVYSVTLNKPDILDDVFNTNEQKRLLTAYNLTEAQLDEYFKEVNYEITIDPQNKLMKSLKTNLSDIFTKLAADYQTANGKAPSLVFDEVSVEIVFSQYNGVDVAIPAEAKASASAN